MGKLIFSAIIVGILYSYSAADCSRTDPLFTIERSQNRNVVHYDACLENENELSSSDPVRVYWIMESGRREDLTWFEKNYAYGITSPKKLEDGGVEMSLAAAGRKILSLKLVRIDERYKVVVSINGQMSILEKLYVECRSGLLGIPKVLYVDVFGRTMAVGAPIVERLRGKS